MHNPPKNTDFSVERETGFCYTPMSLIRGNIQEFRPFGCVPLTGRVPVGVGPRETRRVVIALIRIRTRGNESIDQMLRRFKKLCEKEGLTKDIKRNSYYEKPSEKRRRKRRKALKRTQQEAQEQ